MRVLIIYAPRMRHPGSVTSLSPSMASASVRFMEDRGPLGQRAVIGFSPLPHACGATHGGCSVAEERRRVPLLPHGRRHKRKAAEAEACRVPVGSGRKGSASRGTRFCAWRAVLKKKKRHAHAHAQKNMRSDGIEPPTCFPRTRSARAHSFARTLSGCVGSYCIV